MIQSDALSCCSDHIIKDTDNDDKILLPDNIFVCIVDTNLHGALVKGTTNDSLFAAALEGLKHHGPFLINSQLTDWHFDDGLLFFKDRYYVPSTDSLHRDITSLYHDSLPTSHLGHLKTLELV
jgi:hypothetical protein